MKKSFYSLIGVNGNAFAIMRYVVDAMKECDRSKEEIEEYKAQAMSADYNNLLAVSMSVIEKLNKMIGCKPNAQFTEPDSICESKGTKKVAFKKLVEVLKDYDVTGDDSYNEDGSLEHNDMIDDDYEEPTYDMDDEKQSIIWKALDEASLELWENFGPFDPEDLYVWFKMAVDNYPVEQLSIFKEFKRRRKERSKELD